MISSELDKDVTWISVREAAQILGVSHNTLRKMIKAGEISTLNTFSARKDIVLDRVYVEREAKRREVESSKKHEAVA